MSIVGTIEGNMLGTALFLLFQGCGWAVAFGLLKTESWGLKALSGSVFGSVMLQWLPCLFAFFFGFSKLSHILAAVLALGLALLARPKRKGLLIRPKLLWQYLLPAGTFLVFSFLIIRGFRMENGVVYSSQCTYGDMSMHLGFITSIAQQGVFPPDYSIFTGVRLSYPFLSDSISSSMYLFGASLKLSYVLPMLFAGAQVMVGAFMLLRLWLKSAGRALLAFVLFFFNGGLGFFYFFSGTQENPENFTRIFTEFYQTPTNLLDENVRWVNTVVDMLVPQRATLFGWAVLFTALVFLYRAVYEKRKSFFLVTGILGGALPMIHTHSFLSLALVSACWLFFDLWQKGMGDAKRPEKAVAWGLFALPFALSLLQLFLGGEREQAGLLVTVLALVGVFAAALALLLVKVARKGGLGEIAQTWGIYLGVTLVLALPQLLIWTFQQAAGDQFLRGYFGWANLDDQYLWFYIKNIGVPALFFLPALLWAKGRMLQVLSPVLLIWFIGELVVFQPNTYDNNKLLYVAYLLVCGLLADYLFMLWHKLQGVPGRGLLAGTLLFFCTVSAVLTMGREAVAEYELFNSDQLKAEAYIETVAAPDAVILTQVRHNNAIAALSGRNIVCGSASYVHFHGLDYYGRHEDIEKMYADPEGNQDLLQLYGVEYVMISDYERGAYAVDEEAFARLYPQVFTAGEVELYRVSDRSSTK